MNTFLPFTSFTYCAMCLDDKRLFAQAKECRQIWDAMHYRTAGWVNHPATAMWRPYTELFLSYWRTMLLQLTARGKVDPDCIARWRAMVDKSDIGCMLRDRPWWLDHPAVYVSHRSNLYRKSATLYRAFKCQPIGYFWPDPVQPRYTYLESGYPKSRRVYSLEEANEYIKDNFHIEGVSEL